MRSEAPARRRLTLALGGLLFLVIFAFRYLSYTGFPNDHFEYISRGQQMLLGAWPIRDFVDPGWPLMYMASAMGLLAFGHNLFGEALIAFGAFAAAGALSFWAARAAAGSAVVAAIAVLLQAAAYPRSYSYPKLLLYAAAIVLCWRYLAQPTTQRLVGLAVLVAVAFLFRHDHGLFIALAALLAIAIVGPRPVPALVARVGTFAAVIVLLLTPWLILVQRSGGLAEYFRSAIGYSRVEATQTRLVLPRFGLDSGQGFWKHSVDVPEHPVIHIRWVPSLSPSEREQHERTLGLELVEYQEGTTWRYRAERGPDRVRAIRNDPAVEDTDGLDRLRIGWGEPVRRVLAPLRGTPGPGLLIEQNAEALLYYSFLALPMIAIAWCAGARGAAAPMPQAVERLLIAILLAACVNATFLRDPLSGRLADAAAPNTVLAAWLGAAGWRSVRNRARAVRVLARTGIVVLAVFLAVSVLELGRTTEQFNRIGPLTLRNLTEQGKGITRALRVGYATTHVPAPTSLALAPAFQYLQSCTAPTDRFSYIGYAPEVYFLGSRGFAGGHVVFLGQYYASGHIAAGICPESCGNKLLGVTLPLNG